MLDTYPKNDDMVYMEGKESTHFEKPKLAWREDQGNNNLHDTRYDAEPQLPDR